MGMMFAYYALEKHSNEVWLWLYGNARNVN